jgi:hypothetical protein
LLILLRKAYEELENGTLEDALPALLEIQKMFSPPPTLCRHQCPRHHLGGDRYRCSSCSRLVSGPPVGELALLICELCPEPARHLASDETPRCPAHQRPPAEESPDEVLEDRFRLVQLPRTRTWYLMDDWILEGSQGIPKCIAEGTKPHCLSFLREYQNRSPR